MTDTAPFVRRLGRTIDMCTMFQTVVVCVWVVLISASENNNDCTAYERVTVVAQPGARHLVRVWHDPHAADKPVLKVLLDKMVPTRLLEGTREGTGGKHENRREEQQSTNSRDTLRSESVVKTYTLRSESIVESDSQVIHSAVSSLQIAHLYSIQMYQEYSTYHVSVSGKNTTFVLENRVKLDSGWRAFSIDPFNIAGVSYICHENVFRSLFARIEGLPASEVTSDQYKITFEGSNITVNCYEGFTQYHYHNRTVYVPLPHPHTVNYIVLSISSAASFSPHLQLGPTCQLVLGWDTHSNDVVAGTGVPLPPQRFIRITIHCEHVESTGYLCQFLRENRSLLSSGDSMLESPLILKASTSTPSEAYTFTLHVDDYTPYHHNHSAPASSVDRQTNCSSFDAVMITLLIVASLLLIVIIAVKLLGGTLIYRPVFKSLAWLWPQSGHADPIRRHQSDHRNSIRRSHSGHGDSCEMEELAEQQRPLFEMFSEAAAREPVTESGTKGSDLVLE